MRSVDFQYRGCNEASPPRTRFQSLRAIHPSRQHSEGLTGRVFQSSRASRETEESAPPSRPGASKISSWLTRSCSGAGPSLRFGIVFREGEFYANVTFD